MISASWLVPTFLAGGDLLADLLLYVRVWEEEIVMVWFVMVTVSAILFSILGWMVFTEPGPRPCRRERNVGTSGVLVSLPSVLDDGDMDALAAYASRVEKEAEARLIEANLAEIQASEKKSISDDSRKGGSK